MKSMRYIRILKILYKYYDIEEKDFLNILKSRENKYLLLLLLKNNNCLEIENIKKLFNLKSSKSISYKLKQAEEKLLINRNFREVYFELEDVINNNRSINL